MGKQVSSEVMDKIKHAINSVLPYLLADGGDVELIEVTDDLTVKVRLVGACQGCPFSEQTLRAGIEHAIRNEVPEIKGLLAVDE
jgi:Fe-S cluster biogenesis protein NfuA